MYWLNMVPMAGIGPATSPLPRECSTTEPHGLKNLKHPNHDITDNFKTNAMLERATRLELATFSLENWNSTNWATPALRFALLQHYNFQNYYIWWRGKDSNLRTLRERIYSPSPLTTRPPLLTEPAIMLIFWGYVKQKPLNYQPCKLKQKSTDLGYEKRQENF